MSLTAGKQLLLSSPAGGYQVSRSLRFNSADSTSLTRTFTSAGNRKTWTWSGWVKRSALGGDQHLFTAYVAGNDNQILEFRISSDQLVVAVWTTQLRVTTQVFRDPGAWAHVVLAVDTTQATANDRIKLYWNGTQITQFGLINNPAQNDDLGVNQAGLHSIGREWTGASTFNGYLADIWFLDGIAATPSDFAETDATTGQWIPKTYSGSKGSNGFHLEFADNSNNTASTLGKDTSGNGNNWTPNNFSVLDGITAGTGALPIYNTTSNNYFTKSTGTRTDSFSSSIALAVAMDGANGGTTFTDESATIKGSGSAKSLTVTSVTTSTTTSKFYGSSGYFGTGGSTPNISISPVNTFSNSNFTIELWYYATASQNDRILYHCVNNSSYGILLYMNAGIIQVYLSSTGSSWDIVSGASIGSITTNQWTHIALVRNGNSFTGYMNGSSTSLTTSSSSINATTAERIGGNGSFSFPGYIQDVRVYIGAAKYTSAFTVPSYSPSTAAGNDSLVDTPTSYGTDTGAGGEVRGNYATWNPLCRSSAYATISNGNLDLAVTTNDYGYSGTLFIPSSGKWYFEVTLSATSGNGPAIGIVSAKAEASDMYDSSYASGLEYGGPVYAYNPGQGTKMSQSASTSYVTAASPSANDVFMVAVDFDNGAIYFGKNGTWLNSGVPTSGASKTGAAFTSIDAESYAPVIHAWGTGITGVLNAGQRAFAYTAPTGFKALVDTNLTAPVIAKPNTVMDVKLYTGNGSSQSISNVGFSPDFAWIKQRSGSATAHSLEDIVRGTNKHLASNSTDAEVDVSIYGGGVTAFNTAGFSLGSWGAVNENNQTYVSWLWDAGDVAASSNNSGSIISTVKVNATAGFSIVTWTGTGSGTYTVGHGLGVAPSFIITKFRSAASNWECYHASLGNAYTILLNSTGAALNRPNRWNSTSPTSTVFTIGTDINDAQTCVGYCFSPVTGYSSFGSYTGNGSADGPFVYTGFRPRWIMIKRTDAAYGWYMYDTARDAYNIAGKELLANASDAEVSDSDLDILSNGFKPRRSSLAFNASGGTFVYAAFAENPFQYARAR